ncbi:phage tail protein [Sneathiella glossodoripedis]|uniref:phage tail protein n=1 Tax=Sneathiella glossodoripedis TaxID=418853 RepID=UPI00046EFA86|nr:phage tail protein [Sneathiella glossodoripedis]
MATLALSVAGAGLGQLAGVGAGTGWMLGSTLGRLLTAEKQSGGGNLAPLKVTGASYGASIPIIFGTMRLSGQVIWLGKSRTVKGARGGGKGSVGGGQAGMSQSYRVASFAILICEGEVDSLLKIWANGTSLFDSEGLDARQVSGLSFRFYKGDDTQECDPLIVAEQDGGSAPAYRGCSYVVFEDLNLSSFGNRIPNFEFLVTRQATDSYPSRAGQAATYYPQQMVLHSQRGDVVTCETGAVGKARLLDLQTVSIRSEADVNVTFPELDNPFRGLSRDRDGNIWVGSKRAGENARIHKFNSLIMAEEAEALLPDGVGNIRWSVDIQNPLGDTAVQVAGSDMQAQVLVFGPTLDVLKLVDVEAQSCAGALRDRQEQAWVAMFGYLPASPTHDLQIVRVSITAQSDPTGTLIVPEHEIFNVTSSDLGAGYALDTNKECRMLRYIAGQEELVFQHEDCLFKWSTVSKSVTEIRGGISNYSFIGHAYEGDELVFLTPDLWVVYFRDADLEEVARVDLRNFADLGSLAGVVHDPLSDSVLVLRRDLPALRCFLRRQTGSGAAYAAILSELCERAGLSPEQYDVSGVRGACDGFASARPARIREVAEPLMLAGQLQMHERQGQLVIAKKKAGEPLVIEQSSMMAQPHYHRLQESDLPVEIRLGYLASDAGFQQGAQHARRAHAPYGTQAGQGVEKLTLPMALDASTAKGICQQSLWDGWQERLLADMQLSREFLALDPSDRIKIVDEGGSPLYEGWINESHLGAALDLEIQLTGAANIGGDMPIVADAGSGYVELPVRRPSSAELHLLNIPLLRDEEATAGAGSRLYMAVGAQSPSQWTGAEVYRSALGDRYDPVTTVEEDVAWGVAATALGAPLDGVWCTDRANSLVVRFADENAPLESVSELEMLNGANAALVGEEIIQFATAKRLLDGSYELSTLLRGRRGTDYAVAKHRVGEKVLLLSPQTISSALLPLNAIGQGYYYRAAGIGQYVEEATTHRYVHQGRDLMPYSPVHVTASRSPGELQLTWVRRSRLGAAGLADPLPLAEQSERYEIVFGYEAKAVSHFVSGQSAFAYDLAQFNADFTLSMGELPELSIEIYQHSDAVGRGFAAKEVV